MSYEQPPSRDELLARVEELEAVAGAAGHGWKVAQAAVDKAVDAHRREVDQLSKALRQSNLDRERQRQRAGELNLSLAEAAAERDVLAAIVRDLAAAAGFAECVFCPAETGLHDDHHDTCPYFRARAWVTSQETT